MVCVERCVEGILDRAFRAMGWGLVAVLFEVGRHSRKGRHALIVPIRGLVGYGKRLLLKYEVIVEIEINMPHNQRRLYMG